MTAMSKKLLGRRLLAFFTLFACCVTSACKREDRSTGSASGTPNAPLSIKRGLLIASGLGGIGGFPHSNSVEALRCNYHRGFRWFEVDLAPTAEGELVCFHKGDEKLARLSDRIWNLRIADVEGKKFGDRFPIVRFSRLLDEADRVGDVVLVLDTEGWSKKMEEAVSRTLGNRLKRPTRVIFQAYRENDLERIAPLSKELGAGLLLNLSQMDADDAKVDELVKKNSFLGVVTNAERFTPWLAERLHASQLPILVQTINEHRDIVNLARAGADGFYTDRYVPYDTIATDPTVVMDCGETKPSRAELHTWTERDLKYQADYRLPGCAKRKSGGVELGDCEEGAMLRSTPLAVPAAQMLHVEVEAEAIDTAVSFWLEFVQKKEPKAVRPHEVISLKPKERRALKFDIHLPQGSPGIEARLGLLSKKDFLALHRLVVFQGEKDPDASAISPSEPRDAGD